MQLPTESEVREAVKHLEPGIRLDGPTDGLLTIVLLQTAVEVVQTVLSQHGLNGALFSMDSVALNIHGPAIDVRVS